LSFHVSLGRYQRKVLKRWYAKVIKKWYTKVTKIELYVSLGRYSGAGMKCQKSDM